MQSIGLTYLRVPLFPNSSPSNPGCLSNTDLQIFFLSSLMKMLKVLFWRVALLAIRVGSNCLDLKSWIEMFQGWTFHFLKWKVKVKVGQSCPTLCNPTDYPVHGILQARILEWVAYPFSRGSSQPRDWTQVSHIAGGFFTSWAAREALSLIYFPGTHTPAVSPSGLENERFVSFPKLFNFFGL